MAQIKTFARLKPSKKAYPGYQINKNVLTVHIPDNKDFLVQGPQQVIRSNLSYDIVFTDIFRPEATQDEVFDGVAKDIIQNFLNGYNGTIFAYGQTGTGKTYTVEGNTTRYSTRGLATRALSMIYQQLENRTDEHISVYLSYLEIYQEVAYDLLNPASRTSLPVAPFAKVTVVEGPRGSCILRGLSLHLAANEEIAQMLLLQGQANRKVAETPVNQRSSRSHAVFTVYLQVRKHDSEVLVNSKLHLVDLAGSERVSKTGVDGQQLTEAKSINLSLHHLETVIIALQTDRGSSASSGGGGDRSRGEVAPLQSRSNTSFMSGPSSDNGSKPYKFVPYRNSLLTMVLKDSLGGNCLTAMIATISMEPENLGESISTCRFAQRVARIANNARRNEEVDDKTLIKRLKHKVAYLENQVALLRSKGKNDPITDEEILDVLTEEDRIACARIMEGFLQGVITDPVDAGICDQCRFRECLHLLKHQYLTSQATDGQPMADTPPSSQLQCSYQWRPEGGELTSDHTSHLRPNNPHIDSGDHVMSNTTSQGTSPMPVSMQRPPLISSSQLDVMSSPQRSLIMEDKTDGERSGAEAISASERKCSNVDQLLEACGKDKYKSPYERKRVKEIKKLGRQLTTLEQEQLSQQEQLEQMKQDTLMQELVAAENGLRLKLQVADEQVADQHAYLLQLKHIQADPDLIAREQLVEKQLLKRQAKFQEKLKHVLEGKAQLERDLSAKADASHVSNKKSAEDKFGQFKQGKGSLNTRQVYDMLKNEEKKQQKQTVKVEREKAVVKTKQLAIKEAATLEKLRQLKQMLRMSQQHGEPGFTSEQYESTPGQYHIQSSHSAESHHSDKDVDSFSRFTNCDMRINPDVDSQLHHDQTWTHSRVPSNRNTSRTGELPVFVNPPRNPDQQTQHMQEYLKQVLNGAYLDKLAHNIRQNAQDEKIVPLDRSQHRDEEDFCLVSDHHSPEYKGLMPMKETGSSTGQGNTTANASPNLTPVMQDSPLREGTWPMEVRSFHDPRHSHKFAFDDRPFESSSLNTQKKNNAESLYNNNNKSNHYEKKIISSRDFHTANYNNNAENGVLEDLESNIDFVAEEQGIIEYSGGEKSPALKMSDLKGLNEQEDDQIPTRDTEDNKKAASTSQLKGGTSGYSRARSADHLRSDLLSSQSSQPHQHTKAASSTGVSFSFSTNQHHTGKGTSQPVLTPSEYINSMSSQDKFDARKMGLSSRTFDSALSHMLDIEDAARGPSDNDPYEKYSRTTKTSAARHQSRNVNPSMSSNFSQERLKTRKKDKPSIEGAEGKPIAKTRSAWGPELKNASVADRLLDFLDAGLSSDEQIGYDIKARRQRLVQGNRSLDAFQAKLAQYKMMEQLVAADDECSEDDSFFGLQPAETKLQALTPEEGERTFMSTVAAEKARVEKIRRARAAAEVIQRKWRAFRARH